MKTRLLSGLLTLVLILTVVGITLVPALTVGAIYTNDQFVSFVDKYSPGDEITELRDQYSETFMIDEGYSTRISLGSIHYEESPGNFQPIDTTIVPSDKAGWDWEVTTGHWELFIRNGGIIYRQKGDNWVGYKLHGIAYLDIITKDYTILQTASFGVPIVSGNEIRWNNVLNGVDYVIRYTNDSLKEDIIIKQSARDFLNSPGHRPSDYGYSAQDTYLVPIFEVDWSLSLPMKRKVNEDTYVAVNPDEAELEETIYFESPVKDRYFDTNLVSFFPLDYAVSANPINPEDPEEEWEYAKEKIKKRLIKKNDKHWLLIGVPVTKLNQMPEGSIIFDPTETLRPNAAGDETNIGRQFPDATSHWDKVDEVSADEGSTYVLCDEASEYQRDFYNIPNHSVGSGIISSVKVYVHATAVTTPTQESLKIAIKAGTGSGAPDTVSEGGEEFLPTQPTWETFSHTWTTNPATSAAWTWDEIDKLQIGVALRTPISGVEWHSKCTQVYVVVDYVRVPTITTLDASNIATETARLNAVLTDDGGVSCNVSFAYHHNTASDNWTNADNTTWVAGYNSGSYPYRDITELLYNTKYYFHARARNIVGSANGSILSFTTEALLNIPTNFKAFPETNSVALSWTKGAGTSTTLIRHKVGSYSTNITDGTLVYLGGLNSCEHTGLDSGTTGFYSAFGASGDNYTVTYAMVIATTSGAPVAVAEPDAPSEPTGWFQATDYTQFSAFPLYPFLNDFADAIPLPRNTFWFLLAIGLCLIVGIATGVKAKSGTAAMIVLAASVGLLSGVALLPRFMFAFVVLFLIGAWQMRHQGGGMGGI